MRKSPRFSPIVACIVVLGALFSAPAGAQVSCPCFDADDIDQAPPLVAPLKLCNSNENALQLVGFDASGSTVQWGFEVFGPPAMECTFTNGAIVITQGVTVPQRQACEDLIFASTLFDSVDVDNGDISNCPEIEDDADGDTIPDGEDNCPNDANTDQADLDMDGVGDVCDVDDDNDTIEDIFDNCPNDANPGQENTDNEGVGDACNDAFDLDGDEYEDDFDNCPAAVNPDQVDSDMDDLGNACDTCPNDPGACAVDADVTFDKAEVKFKYGEVKIYGNLSVPPGYWSDNLNLTGSARLLLSGTDVTSQAVAFELKGDDNKKFEYETEDDDLVMGIEKLKVDFKGAKFDYKHDNGVDLKTTFIGGEETTIEVKTDSDSWPTTIMIGSYTIAYDAAGNITTDLTYELYKEGETKKVFFTLPIQLLSSTSVVVDGDVVDVGDNYKEGTVKFKLEARFDETQPPFADTDPKTLELDLSLGGAVSASGLIGEDDWKEIKDDKWKL